MSALYDDASRTPHQVPHLILRGALAAASCIPPRAALWVAAALAEAEFRLSPRRRAAVLANLEAIGGSGRPGLEFHIEFARARIGEFDVDLVHEFFQGFVNHAQVTLHVDNLKGVNAHHQAETAFKAFGRALRMAVEADPRVDDVPSTKGSL